MKKSALLQIFIFYLILLVVNVSAIEITLSKSSYSPQEIFQAEITGYFINLKSENILIYKEGIPRQSPIISDLFKWKDKYYFYAILPNQEDNFSLRIENAQYLSSGKLEDEKIIKNFIIQKSNESSLSINPGFIVADEDFSVKIKSLNNNLDVSAELEETGQTKNISLIEGIEKTIKFSISGSNQGKLNLKINNYNIPVFIIKKINESKTEESQLNFIVRELTGSLVPGKNYFFKIIVSNSGNKNLTNIKLSSDLNVVITPDLITFLEAGESILINTTLSVSEKQKENLSGKITAEFDNNTVNLPIFFEMIRDEKKVELKGTSVTETLSCMDLGKICLEDRECEGEITASLEGPCCIGECIKIKKSNYRWIYGTLLIITLIAIMAFAFYKIKKRQKPKSTEEILKERSERYRRKMEGGGEEVSGSIGRV